MDTKSNKSTISILGKALRTPGWATWRLVQSTPLTLFGRLQCQGVQTSQVPIFWEHSNGIRVNANVAVVDVVSQQPLNAQITTDLLSQKSWCDPAAPSFLTTMTSSSLGNRGKVFANEASSLGNRGKVLAKEATSCGRFITCPL